MRVNRKADAAGGARSPGPPGWLAALLFIVAGCASAVAAGKVGAIQNGKASYYAHSLAGHRTASGERYDPKAFTAAHARLPLGTIVRVTRTTGASVVVRINDRCGCGGGHIVDLSEAAARRLDMIRAGSVAVRVEVLRP
jgi:rare lipoprotein A